MGELPVVDTIHRQYNKFVMQLRPVMYFLITISQGKFNNTCYILTGFGSFVTVQVYMSCTHNFNWELISRQVLGHCKKPS